MFWKGIFSVAVLCSSLLIIEGCKHGAGKKRAIYPSEVDPHLAGNITECLRPIADDIFPSLRSAVEYSIRDTKWFKDTKEILCSPSGGNYNGECWVTALLYLLDIRSVLFQETAKCICEWTEDCFKEDGEIFEPIVPDETKRSISDRRHLFVGPCVIYSKPCILTELDMAVSKCVEQNVTDPAALDYVDGESIAILLKGHSTFCRTGIRFYPTLTDNPFAFATVQLEKSCSRQADWRQNLTEIYDENLHASSPLWTSYTECKNELQKMGVDEFVGQACEDEFQRCEKDHCGIPNVRKYCRKTCGVCVT